MQKYTDATLCTINESGHSNINRSTICLMNSTDIKRKLYILLLIMNLIRSKYFVTLELLKYD